MLEIIVIDYDGKFCVVFGWIDIFMYLGYEFKVIDGLIINFYLLKLILIMFVSVFVNRDNVFYVYNEVVKEKYCFFSFGDVMFVVFYVKMRNK